MLNFFSKLLLFYFAYLPLILILVIQNMPLSWILLGICSILVLLGFISTKILFSTVHSVAPRNETLNIIANKNSDALSFIVTYILPFGVTFSSLNNWIAFGILFSIIFYLYIESSLFRINPLLKIFFKYNIYSVSLNNEEFFLLSKKDYVQGKIETNVVYLTSCLMVEGEK